MMRHTSAPHLRTRKADLPKSGADASELLGSSKSTSVPINLSNQHISFTSHKIQSCFTALVIFDLLPYSPPQSINSNRRLTRRNKFTMVLEAVMIVVDNSESSRNGDYTPTRFEAQSDAVSLIFSAITQGNPESSVGLMSMGGKGPEVLVTLTTDHGKILEGLHRTKTKIRGNSHLATGIQIAGVSH